MRNANGHLRSAVESAARSGGSPVRRLNRRRLFMATGAVVIVLVGAFVWFGLSVRVVEAELTAARDDLVSAQASLSDRDVEAASTMLISASEHADSARSATSSPVWGLAESVPVMGATPETVRAIATALDQAVVAIVPAAQDLVELQLAKLIGPNGKVDGSAISAALPALQAARSGVSASATTLAGAPSDAAGDLVLGPVERARTELAKQLASVNGTLDTVIRAAEIVPPLIGVDRPKRYFVAILNPNESRGIGGFLGTWAIMAADAGRLTLEEVGSNNDLPGFTTLPIDLGKDFAAHYGDGAGHIANFNISPHFPNAARLWLASWEQRTGERLDGALSADVVALGQLVTASGGSVRLPEGGFLTGDALTDFALAGIYEKFPTEAQSMERKEYQEAVARQAAKAVIAGTITNSDAVASALAAAMSEGRVLAWVRDKNLQAQIIETPLGGSLSVANGPHVAFVAINSSMSKLDTYLERSVRYDVGQCPDERGRVRSGVEVTLTSAIPEGASLPEYVIANAELGPDGPINSVLAQLHLPNRARILDVQVDGHPAAYSPFTEEGRTSLALDVVLPPREARTITVSFDEPFVEDEATVVEQPLAHPQETLITLRTC